jgi:hypothetical protein
MHRSGGGRTHELPVAAGPKLGGGCTKDKARNPVGVAVGAQLCNGAAHAVANCDKPVDAKGIGHCDSVVGAVA